jgi:hypothetical protein
MALPLPLMALAQATDAWVGPSMAFSLIVIAVVAVLSAIASAILVAGALKSSQNIGKEVAELRSELKPALDGIRDLTQSGTGLATRVEGEVQEIVRTSQRIRSEVDRGLRRAKHRLAEFDAVTEVVQEEFEETALDIAATLRTVRKGRGVIGRIRRLLRRGGRR